MRCQRKPCVDGANCERAIRTHDDRRVYSRSFEVSDGKQVCSVHSVSIVENVDTFVEDGLISVGEYPSVRAGDRKQSLGPESLM